MAIDKNPEPEHKGLILETAFETEFRRLADEEADNIPQAIKSHRTSDRLGLPPPSEEYPTDPAKFQDFNEAPVYIRRMWLAIDQKIDTLIRHIGKNESALKSGIKGIITSVGHGSVSLKTTERLSLGEVVLIRLIPPSFPPFIVDIAGEVKNISDATSGKTPQKIYKLEFRAINSDDREILISYIFRRQREILRSIRDEEDTAELERPGG